MFRGASIILSAIIITFNFRAPQPPQSKQSNQNLRIRPSSSFIEIISFVSTRADSASFSSVLLIHSAATAAAAANPYLHFRIRPPPASSSFRLKFPFYRINIIASLSSL